MPAFEDILKGMAGQRGADGTPEPSGQGQEVEFDVAGFVQELGKTAELLDKVAEKLPTTPAMAAANLRMLNSPLGFNRQDVHDQAREFVGQVLPQAKGSLQIPRSIGKVASGPGRGVLAGLMRS